MEQVSRRTALQLGYGASLSVLAGCTAFAPDGCDVDPIEIGETTWANARNTAANSNAVSDLGLPFVEEWRVETDLSPIAPMVGAAGDLYYVERGGGYEESVRALDGDGDEAWSVGAEIESDDVPDDHLRFVTHLATDGRRVYVAARFSVPDGDAPTDPNAEGAPNRSSRESMHAAIAALDAGDGSVEWTADAWRPLDLKIDTSGRLYLTEYSDRNFRSGAYEGMDGYRDDLLRARALEARTGAECWRYPEGSPVSRLFGWGGGVEFENRSAFDTVVDDEYVNLPTVPTGSDAGSTTITVLEKATGVPDRTIDLPFALWRGLSLVDGTIYLDGDGSWATRRPSINAVDSRTGERKWEAPIEEIGSAMVVGANADAIVGYSYNRRVFALDPDDGAELWSVDAPAFSLGNGVPVFDDYALVPVTDADDPQHRSFTAIQVHHLERGDRLDRIDFGTEVRFHGAIATGKTLFLALGDADGEGKTVRAIRRS